MSMTVMILTILMVLRFLIEDLDVLRYKYGMYFQRDGVAWNGASSDCSNASHTIWPALPKLPAYRNIEYLESRYSACHNNKRGVFSDLTI
jgi:hypothetical protein